MSAIQIKNVPEEVRAVLVEAAKSKGQSLQGYLLDTLAEQAQFARNVELMKKMPVEGSSASMSDAVSLLRTARGDLPVGDESEVGG